MKIVLTGDRPTGKLHLGHYVGSLQNRLKMQKNHETFIMIADVQALTDYFENPSFVANNVYSVVRDYLSCGIDPNYSTIFVQSQINALFELSMYYMNLVTLSRVQRNPTVKEELLHKSMKDNVNCGFVCYPISQAADITAFSADYVPVGKDQLPMIEQTNEIVRKFNSIYKTDVLNECKAILSKESKLLGINGGAKASKSLNNCIFLSDEKEVVRQKVFSMYTDPSHIKISDPGKIEGNIVFHYLDVFYENKLHLNQLKEDYKKGGLGDVYLKTLLLNELNELLTPIREKRKLINDEMIKDILLDGNKKANEKANETLLKVKKAMCLKY